MSRRPTPVNSGKRLAKLARKWMRIGNKFDPRQRTYSYDTRNPRTYVLTPGCGRNTFKQLKRTVIRAARQQLRAA